MISSISSRRYITVVWIFVKLSWVSVYKCRWLIDLKKLFLVWLAFEAIRPSWCCFDEVTYIWPSNPRWLPLAVLKILIEISSIIWVLYIFWTESVECLFIYIILSISGNIMMDLMGFGDIENMTPSEGAHTANDCICLWWSDVSWYTQALTQKMDCHKIGTAALEIWYTIFCWINAHAWMNTNFFL